MSAPATTHTAASDALWRAYQRLAEIADRPDPRPMLAGEQFTATEPPMEGPASSTTSTPAE